jgi:hypothetical protein
MATDFSNFVTKKSFVDFHQNFVDFQFFREDEFLPRWEEVLGQLTTSGTYELRPDELGPML